MLPASNKGAGMNIGFPDVCLTPAGPTAVPVPYPNLALNAQAAPFGAIVRVSMLPALNMGSMIPMTSGDEGGVAHPTIKGPGTYTMGNPKVFIEKLPGINLTCPTTGNGMNNGLGAVLVPSVTNVFYTYAGTAPGGEARGLGGGGGGEEVCPGGGAGLPGREIDAAELRGIAEVMSAGVLAAEMLEGGVLYVRIGAFAPALASEMWSLLSGAAVAAVSSGADAAAVSNGADAAGAADAAGVAGVVIDLAGCPGGDLMACLEAAGDFVPAGTGLATVVEADGDETDHVSRCKEPFSGPVAILVDRRTASAAEVFAGCLSACGRAVLVGARTFGKGSGQKLVAAESGAVRSLSVAEVLLPGGRRIEGEGLSPDIEAGSPEEARALAVGAVRAAC